MKKDNSKTFAIIGVVGFGLYFLVTLIMTIVNIADAGSFKIVLSTLWGLLKSLVLFGVIAFYLIYGIVKKSDKLDKIVNIVLCVDLALIVLNFLVQIFKTLSSLAKFGDWYSAATKIYYFLSILRTIVEIGAVALLAVCVIGLILKKKMPYKMMTMGTGLLFVVSILFYILSDIIGLFQYINLRLLFVNVLYLLYTILFVVPFVCLALVINNKTKEIK